MIGATILNISKQDYDPQGASVNILIAEGHVSPENIDKSCNQGLNFGQNDTIHAHLDKVMLLSIHFLNPIRKILYVHSELILMFQHAEKFLL